MIEHRKTSVMYRGDGVTTSFPFSFDISSADTIRVAVYDTVTEVTTEITRDYFVDVSAKTVHYPGYAPGQAPVAAAQPPKLPNGKTITIYRKTPINQLTNLGTKYPLPSIEAMSDKATAILQEHEEVLGRTVRLPAGDPKTTEQRLADMQTYVSDAKSAAGAAAQSASQANSSKNVAASSASASAQSAAASERSRQASAAIEAIIANMQTNVRAMESHVEVERQHIDTVKNAVDAANAQAQTANQNAATEAEKARRSAGESAQSAAEAEAAMKKAQEAAKFEGIVESKHLADGAVTPPKIGFSAGDINAYTKGEINEKFAPLASPALTGIPTAPTAVAGTNNTQIASTACNRRSRQFESRRARYTAGACGSARQRRKLCSDHNQCARRQGQQVGRYDDRRPCCAGTCSTTWILW